MPLYDFLCEGCGRFEAWRPVTDPGAACPSCSLPARRVFSAPAVRRMAAPLRTALQREERSSAVPELVSAPRRGRPLHLGHH
jgi:putative FmdB family regulatory protein